MRIDNFVYEQFSQRALIYAKLNQESKHNMLRDIPKITQVSKPIFENHSLCQTSTQLCPLHLNKHYSWHSGTLLKLIIHSIYHEKTHCKILLKKLKQNKMAALSGAIKLTANVQAIDILCILHLLVRLCCSSYIVGGIPIPRFLKIPCPN